MPDIDLSKLKPDVSKRIRPFFDDVLSEYSENIHSICLVGSAVTGDFSPETSDINSIFVLKEMDLGFLEKLAPRGRKYGKSRVAAPYIMTPEYIKNSTDVFPVEFLSFKMIHETVYGPDVFGGIQLDIPHMRRQCERELKAKLIGLRQGYISTGGDKKLLTENFIRMISSYMPLFRGIIFLFGKTPPVLYEEVLNGLSETTGLDCGIFKKMLQEKKERKKMSIEELNAVFEEYYKATERLAGLVDNIKT